MSGSVSFCYGETWNTGTSIFSELKQVGGGSLQQGPLFGVVGAFSVFIGVVLEVHAKLLT